MNFQPTADIIKEAAILFSDLSKRLNYLSEKMIEDQDYEIAGDVLNEIRNCNNNVRIDLIALRPMRELDKEDYNK